MTPDLESTAERALSGLDARTHEPFRVDGFEIERTLCPRDADDVGHMLSELQGSGLGVLVRGGGSAFLRGNLPRRADLVLETRALSGIDEFDHNDGVMHVLAGTPLSEVRAAAHAEGWELPLDPPDERATLGGVLARAGTGPRELGWGPARDCVLGLDVVLPSGVRTHCGGRVVKNVTGFDLAKLYTGSFGSLGVIDGAWLRLRPCPEAVRVLQGQSDDPDLLIDWARQASRRVTARAVAVASPEAASEITGEQTDAWHWWTELAGEAAAVEQDAKGLLSESLKASLAPGGLDGVRDFQGRCLEPGGLRARLDLLPTRLAAASTALSSVTAGQLLYPGQGTLYAYAEARTVDIALQVSDEVAAAADAPRARGRVCLEAIPTAAKLAGDVFRLSGGERAILESLKQRFDPEGLLNPGRGPGGL